jgi:two-component system, LytTR family, response regulator
MLRVILIDDEPLARQGMRQLLAAQPELQVVAEADGIEAGRQAIQKEKPDAIFLDIQMPGGDGFELLKGLEHPPKVIFVTAYSKHAIRAFEVQAIDYLLKPVSPSRLNTAIKRLLAICGAQESDEAYKKEDRLCLRTPERTIVAPVESIVALEAEGDYTRIFVADETPLLIWQSLGSYEKILPDPPFVRLDRSLMINLDRIARAEHLSRDETHLGMHGVTQNFILGRAAQSRLSARLG